RLEKAGAAHWEFPGVARRHASGPDEVSREEKSTGRLLEEALERRRGRPGRTAACRRETGRVLLRRNAVDAGRNCRSAARRCTNYDGSAGRAAKLASIA